MAVDGQYRRLVSPAQWDRAITPRKMEIAWFMAERLNHRLGESLPPCDNQRLRQRRFTNNDAFTTVHANVRGIGM